MAGFSSPSFSVKLRVARSFEKSRDQTFELMKVASRALTSLGPVSRWPLLYGQNHNSLTKNDVLSLFPVSILA